MSAVCDDFESAPIEEREKVLLRYLAKTNDAPADVALEDVERVKQAGWSEDAIYDAVTVSAIFNFFNRWIDATGVADVPKGFYEERLAAQGDMGYAM